MQELQQTDRHSLYGFEMREPDLRRRPEDRKTHNVKQLWQRSHEIVNLSLRGLKQTQIAELLEITPQTVSNILNSDLGMQKLSGMRRTRDEEAVHVSERIADLTEKALDVYNKIFDLAVPNLVTGQEQKAANTVMLELSGHRAATRIESRSMSTTATLEEIEEFKRRGIAAAKESGMIVVVADEGKGKNGGSNGKAGQALHGSHPSHADGDDDIKQVHSPLHGTLGLNNVGLDGLNNVEQDSAKDDNIKLSKPKPNQNPKGDLTTINAQIDQILNNLKLKQGEIK